MIDVANYLGELNENTGSRAEKPPASAKKSKTIEKKVPPPAPKKTNENLPQAAKPPIPFPPKKLPPSANHESSNQQANKQECKVLKQVTNLSQQQSQGNHNESTRKITVITNDDSECEFDTVNSSTNNLTDSQSFANNSCNSSSNTSSGQDSANNENNNASGRRAKKQVSYKEPALNSKLRRDSENKICFKEKRNSQQMKIEPVDNENSNS
jgi:hypothetical protein